ncbi:MAG: hypothetical protein ABGX22_10650, partial [Pirellulaceae bacterium]
MTARRPFGLPTADELSQYNIWDSYFLPLQGPDDRRFANDIARSIPTIEKAAIKRLCVFLHVGLGTADRATEARLRGDPAAILAPLKKWPDRLLGMMRLNPMDVRGSLDALNRW